MHIPSVLLIALAASSLASRHVMLPHAQTRSLHLGRNGNFSPGPSGNAKARLFARQNEDEAQAAGNDGNDGANNDNNDNNNNDDEDPQTSLTLDDSQIMPGLALTGQETPAEGQVASATSTNNFINFCLTRSDLPLTNGAQVTAGSCNPVPMGVIGAADKAPSCKFVNPKNLDTIPANEDFTIEMAIRNLATGNFVNAQANYFAAPQNTNDNGFIIGHSHVVIEEIESLTSTTPSNPQEFAFFKGLNLPAENGILSAGVPGGLPAGVYKLSSINSASNHQPALIGVAQHGSLDDAIYFTVTENGAGAEGGDQGESGEADTGGDSVDNGDDTAVDGNTGDGSVENSDTGSVPNGENGANGGNSSGNDSNDAEPAADGTEPDSDTSAAEEDVPELDPAAEETGGRGRGRGRFGRGGRGRNARFARVRARQ